MKSLSLSRQYRALTALAVAAFSVFGVALTLLALREPLYAAGAVYALLFWIIGWRWPAIPLMLVLVAVPFQNDVGGGGFAKFSVAEVNLVLILPLYYLRCLLEKRPMRVGPIGIPVLLYFAVCGYSTWGEGWHGNDSLISLLQMFLYFIVAVSVFCAFPDRQEQLYPVLYGAAGIGAFLAIAGVATGFTFLGLNKNGVGSSLACTAIVCFELWFAAPSGKRRLALSIILAINIVGLFLSLSRGAWLGTLVGLLLIVAMRRQFRLLLQMCVIAVPVVAVCWNSLPDDKKEYATGIGKERENIRLRYASVDIAKSYFDSNPVFGQGVGLRKEYDATNIAWVTLAETGYLGCITFFLIHGVYFRMIWTTQKRVSRYDPAFSFLTIGGAIVLDKLAHGMVDHYWSRGAIMMAWAGAGMATSVYHTVRYRETVTTVVGQYAPSKRLLEEQA